jgi:selenocysteine lyase/cysteine desulfurase
MDTNLNRRELLAGAAAALAAPGAAAVPDFSASRKDFPWIESEVFLNNAGWHPVGAHSIRAMQAYLDYKLRGPGEGREDFHGGKQESVKRLFAQLIHAKPREIAFVPSTLVGENLVVAGLGIPASQWNVVTDELHYEGSLYMYQNLQRAGLDLRVVKQREYRIDVRDVEKVVDRKTRLIATSLVSYVNGFKQDARALSGLAHAHGAYLYTDIIQAAGSTPIDVEAMGIDFAACSGYKWLMGDRGLGYLFVREELWDRVMRRTQYGDRQFRDFEYHMFPYDKPGKADITWEYDKPSAGGFYEVGNISNIAAAAQSAALPYILNLGVENILAHASNLTAKLRKEMPGLGYPCITPEGNPSPTVSFVVKDPETTRAKLARARVAVKVEWRQMRVSPSVYNNAADIDKLLNALG